MKSAGTVLKECARQTISGGHIGPHGRHRQDISVGLESCALIFLIALNEVASSGGRQAVLLALQIASYRVVRDSETTRVLDKLGTATNL